MKEIKYATYASFPSWVIKRGGGRTTGPYVGLHKLDNKDLKAHEKRRHQRPPSIRNERGMEIEKGVFFCFINDNVCIEKVDRL